ncbi:MAG: ATP-binding protein [Thermodesulfovibrionales bacterium]|jgi:PAS domain S-box-containing protein
MKKDPLGDVGDLRKRAEERLVAQHQRLSNLSEKGMEQLVHELGTHQIELEMQNEELKRAQAELENLMRRYTDLYEFAPIGYFMLDEKGVVHSVNAAGARMLGVEKDRILRMPFSRFIAKDDRDSFFAHLRKVFGGRMKQTAELRLRGKGEAALCALFESIASEDYGDETSQCRTAVIDITERKQAEEDVKQIKADLERSNKDLEQFAYSVSHDLREPLWLIHGFIHLMSEKYSPKLDEEGKDYIRLAQASSERMKDSINALLDMARFARGPLSRSKVNLSALAKSVAADLAKKQPERRVEFVIPEDVSAEGEPALLRIVIENLMGNAWKYSNKKPVARIELSVRLTGGETVYCIIDNGTGFDMGFANKLFAPFQRLHSEDEFPGLGIGLTTVRQIIARHGGRIWAESEVNGGATFCFTL